MLQTDFELSFAGAFRMITKKRSTAVSIPLSGDVRDYERICNVVSGYVTDSIPYIILRDGQNLEELIKSGERIRSNDSLTVVPLILGG
ncbi:hypothetical protein B4O97_13485 [Marispirochaeta aestuarii]|uniref:Molybdopterin synthase sulfur carrier subunit n=1 Tax=Marispirochaeta aestuarii TaxID=1963862 RepID=A0A1Y1RVL0_9SPIO|nr:hypothetical protein [Marispirochaeta aestuarii]ORC34091.1 hypothetical protein B4O97_13485 [Marispirochaeta aestuarii]